jgi:hypothetical protein
MPRYQVTLDGKTFVVEGDRPPSEDEARQAFAAYQPPKAEPAKPEERSVSGFLGNVASSGGKFIKDTITGLPEAAKMAATGWGMVTDPLNHTKDFESLRENAPRIMSAAGAALKNRYGGVQQIKDTLYNDPVGVASDISTVMMPAKAGLNGGGFTKLANIAGTVGEATNPAKYLVGMPGKALKAAATPLYEAGLSRTPTMRADFPNAAARGVSEGVIPTPSRVQSVLTAAEEKLTGKVAAHDRARPTVRGYLPPAREAVPLGATPTPSGGRAVLADADRSVFPKHNEATAGPSRQNLDALVDTKQDIGGAYPALPTERLGFDAEARRLAESIGPQSRLSPSGPMLGNGSPAHTSWETQFHGTGSGAGVADAVEGPGVVYRNMESAPGRGAPASMVDPRAISSRAQEIAAREGKVNSRGLRSEAQAELQGYVDQFNAENTRPMTAAQTLDMKRAEQNLANYEARQPGKNLKGLFHTGTAAGAREQLGAKVNGITDDLAKEQDLIGLLAAAERPRPGALRHLFSVGIGSGLMGQGHPVAGLAVPALMEASRNPFVMGAAGITADRAGRAMSAEASMKAALIARLMGPAQ